MDFNKFTENSLKVLQNSQNLAEEKHNSEIQQSHLLYSLITLSNSIIYELLSKMNVKVNELVNDLESNINKMAKVSGGQVYLSVKANETLTMAFKIAENMKDEFVSVEHIFIALMRTADASVTDLFKKYNINEKTFKEELIKIRGNTKVTTQNPEETYNVL